MYKDMKKKLLTLHILFFILTLVATYFFMENNSFLYEKNIGKVISVKEVTYKTVNGDDGKHTYEEKYIRQSLKIKLLNGKKKGRILLSENRYEKSEVYTVKLSPGDKIFVEKISLQKGQLHGLFGGVKRDTFVILVLVFLFGMFLLIGGKHGILTIFSLILNMAAFYLVLLLYLKGVNLLFTMIPMSIFFTAMLLFFMYGKNKRTYLSFVSTIITVLITVIISTVIIYFGGQIDYDFMDYLIMPYSQRDAGFIFISEILVGCLGAVMDVVVTMIMTVDQISETAEAPGRKEFISSCREVGDDLVGTMITLMFFTNIAASMPNIILSMRNGIGFRTILRYNSFFELARFLTGSISVVLAIPISGAIAIYYYRKTCQRERPGKSAKI